LRKLNRDLKRKVEPLEKEASRIRKRLEEIESEITAYVRALGKGQLSIKRLEREIASLETDRQLLEPQYAELQRNINDSISRDFNTDVLQRTLSNFQTAFSCLTPEEKGEALQCVLKTVTVHSTKLDLEIFELEEFRPGSQNREEWLPGLDSN
jgi:chromosome segregation ATPase